MNPLLRLFNLKGCVEDGDSLVEWAADEITTLRQQLEQAQAESVQAAQQGSVPECPYPCGWDNLFKIIVENTANFARSTLDDEIPDSVRQMGIDPGQYAIRLCQLAMQLPPQPPQGTAK